MLIQKGTYYSALKIFKMYNLEAKLVKIMDLSGNLSKVAFNLNFGQELTTQCFQTDILVTCKHIGNLDCILNNKYD